MSGPNTHSQQRPTDPAMLIEYHPITIYLHEGDYLRNYGKARKAERRGDPVEAAKWYRLSTECLRAAAMLNTVHAAVYDRGHTPQRGAERITSLLGRKYGGKFGKKEKNPSFSKGRRREHFWVVKTNE